jgi:hypothetical protein
LCRGRHSVACDSDEGGTHRRAKFASDYFERNACFVGKFVQLLSYKCPIEEFILKHPAGKDDRNDTRSCEPEFPANRLRAKYKFSGTPIKYFKSQPVFFAGQSESRSAQVCDESNML